MMTAYSPNLKRRAQSQEKISFLMSLKKGRMKKVALRILRRKG